MLARAMNHISTSTWSPMVSGPEEDFSSFLEFGDLQLTFPGFDGGQQNRGEPQEDAGAMETSAENTAVMMGIEEGHIQQQLEQPTSMLSMSGYHGSTQPFPMTMQTEYLEQPHFPMQGQQYHHIVPPTPNSIEMHGDHARYSQPALDPQAQAIYERYRRRQKDQVRDDSPQTWVDWS